METNETKKINIISPITVVVVVILDIAVVAYGVFAVMKLVESPTASAIFFAAIEVIALIVGILTTREVLSNYVIFRDDELEFTGVDGMNIFDYENIGKIEVQQDTSVSFTKNFVDRHTLLIFTLKDAGLVTIDIGLTTKGTVAKLIKELGNYISPEIITRVKFEKKNKKKNASSAGSKSTESTESVDGAEVAEITGDAADAKITSDAAESEKEEGTEGQG